MIVSEKLRRLGVYEDRGGDSIPVDIWTQDTGSALIDALPALIAVVDAAEHIINYGATEPMARGVALGLRPQLDAALDVLNKTLGDAR